MSNRSQRRKRKMLKAFEIIFISMLMVVAAAGGIYFAKLYTTPYNNVAADSFQDDTLDRVEIMTEKCNILIMGTDKSGMLTDVMMLAQIDPVAEKATVMSIPRDTYMVYNGQHMRINSVHSIGYNKETKSGSEAAIVAVKELTGVPIHHYVKVNFDAFEDCIDELGGVDFDVPQRMKYTDPYQDLYIDLQPGQQHLDGDKAEQLVRYRSYEYGDIDRIKVQQAFLHELASQKLSLKYVGKIDEIYSIVVKNMETSMSPENFVQCGQQLLEIGTENIKTLTLPTTMVENETYVSPLYDEIEVMCEENF